MFIAVDTEPCALHDIWPCAICNGDLAKQERDLREIDSGTRIAPGVVLARYPGHCAGCGLNFGEESPIRWSDSAGGFIAMGCCG